MVTVMKTMMFVEEGFNFPLLIMSNCFYIKNKVLLLINQICLYYYYYNFFKFSVY